MDPPFAYHTENQTEPGAQIVLLLQLPPTPHSVRRLAPSASCYPEGGGGGGMGGEKNEKGKKKGGNGFERTLKIEEENCTFGPPSLQNTHMLGREWGSGG